MSSLARFQRRFLDALFDDSPQERGFEVYRRNVRGNHEAALRAAYPVVERLVGAHFFGEAARRFARSSPSRSGDLHGFGARFPAFIEAYDPARELAYLADVARLEWAVHESLHEDDARSLAFDDLARVDPARYGELRLRLHPAVRLVASEHPVLAIWEANQPARDGAPERDEGAERVLVRREGGAVKPALLATAEWEFLQRIARGELLEQACRAFGEDGAALAAALSRHALGGVFSAFELPAAARA